MSDKVSIYYPPFPEPHHERDDSDGTVPFFTAGQMLAYARAALKAQPAPTEAQGDPNKQIFENIEELRSAAAAVVSRWDSPKWKEEASTADFIGRLRKALSDNPNLTTSVATYQLMAVQGEDSARLDGSDLATIEEATKVLESAAKHNEGLGRTVFAHAQRDRATRLRAILNRVAAQPQEPES